MKKNLNYSHEHIVYLKKQRNKKQIREKAERQKRKAEETRWQTELCV